MPVDTIDVDLGDGDSAKLFTKMLHGTTRKIMDIYRPFLNTPEIIAKLEGVIDRATYVQTLHEIVGPTADHMGANNALILGQVESWTFGVVSLSVLDRIPSEQVAILLEEANKLYNEGPLAESGARS